MKCPTCDTPKMIVIASRDTPENMYRHRLCVNPTCKQRVTTIEMYSSDNLDLPLPPEQRTRKKKKAGDA